VAGRLTVCLNVTVAPNVPDSDPPLAQDPPDEELTVAPGGVFFAAKQGYPTIYNLSF